MASLLSASQKAALEAVMDDVHDTFARDIVVFKFASETIISSDLNYNPLYQTAGQTTSIVNTPTSGTYLARIRYADKVNIDYWSENNAKPPIKLPIPAGGVRIRVNSDAYDFIKDGQRFDVDDVRYVIDSVGRPHGLFSNKYYDFYLKPDP